MSDFEERKRNAVTTFANVVRTSSAAGQIDAQRLMMAMTSLLAPLEEGQPIDLTPVEELFNEHGVDKQATEEVFVFFASRADKHGFHVLLPSSMAGISDARRERIIEKFNKAPHGATYSGKQKADAPLPGKPDVPSRDKYKGKKKNPDEPNRKLIIGGLLFILAGGGFAYHSWETVPEGAKSLPPIKDDPSALPCDPLIVLNGAAHCDVPTKVLDGYTKSEFNTRLERTLSTIQAAHPEVKSLGVRYLEDGRPYVPLKE